MRKPRSHIDYIIVFTVIAVFLAVALMARHQQIRDDRADQLSHFVEGDRDALE